jgi:aldose 1-epimerase
VLGYNSLDEYLQDTASIGVTVGRYANRIADGKFTLNGTEYDIGRNEVARNGHLHGGEVGFQKKNWALSRCFENAFELTLHSPDGDMGYPGNLDLVLRVALDEPDTLSFTYTATTDKDTVVNFTNHAYFNLNGYDGGDILDTELQLFANAILPVNERLIPNGDYLPVEGTPFDFQNAKPIGTDIRASHEQLLIGGGYDHNFILSTDGFAKAAAAHSPRSGITMECYTDQPGIQLYTGNFLESSAGKGGPMTRHQGFCLETQHYPDSPHHPQFPTTVLKVGETFSSRTAYKFIY